MIPRAQPDPPFIVDRDAPGADAGRYCPGAGYSERQLSSLILLRKKEELAGPGSDPYPVVFIDCCLVCKNFQLLLSDTPVAEYRQPGRWKDEVTLPVKADPAVDNGSVLIGDGYTEAVPRQKMQLIKGILAGQPARSGEQNMPGRRYRPDTMKELPPLRSQQQQTALSPVVTPDRIAAGPA